MFKRTKIYENSIRIKRPQREVLAFISDLRNFKKLHPYIVQLEEMNTTGDFIKQYKAVDKFPIFFYWTKRMEYISQLTEVTDDHITIKAYPGGGIDITINYYVTKENEDNQCVVREKSTVTGNLLMLPMAFKGLSDSHGEVLENLKWLMEWKY